MFYYMILWLEMKASKFDAGNRSPACGRSGQQGWPTQNLAGPFINIDLKKRLSGVSKMMLPFPFLPLIYTKLLL